MSISKSGRWVTGGLMLSLALVTASCGGDGDATTTPPTSAPGSASGGTTIAITEKDFSIAADPGSAPAGAVTFQVTNEGPSVHEFVVFKTDLAEDALPVDGGTVDEESSELTAVDEIEDIAVGSSPTLDVDLDSGAYVLICNVAGHYESGMHTAFTVS
jgi:uncharacterized cupredoxin-like copper-binding protein